MIINIHLNPPEKQEQRFDTLLSPSGTIATLLEIERELGELDIIGIDEAYPGEQGSKEKIRQIILNDAENGKKSLLLFTILLYNSERTIKYIGELKDEFGDNIKIALGGQLVPHAKEAYLKNPNIDIVCTGDAEVILPKLLSDYENNAVKNQYEGWVKNQEQKRFSGVSYDEFYKIRERMQEQKNIAGYSRLTIQGPGGPGCAWAANNPKGSCSFCALQNITTMSENTIDETLKNEKELQQKFNPDRFFDTANQFLPSLNHKEIVDWLNEYIEKRNNLNINADKYVYLIAGSVNEEIAKLLKQAGVSEVYLGIDHFHKDTLVEINKPHKSKEVLKNCLDALRKNEINFRVGIVLGATKETGATLDSVRNGIDWLIREYKENLKSVGVFPVEILPGSRIFDEIQKSGLCPDLLNKFADKGYLTREDQKDLTKIFINENSEISFDEINELEKEISDKLTREGIYEYTVDRSPEITDLEPGLGIEKKF